MVTATDGSFSAEFPNQPKREENTQTAAGVNLVVVTYTSSTGKSAVTLSYTDSPVELDETSALNGAVEGSASRLSGTVKANTDTTIVDHNAADHNAKDVQIETKDATVYERIFLVGKRLYTIVAASEKRTRPSSYDRLLETFKLL